MHVIAAVRTRVSARSRFCVLALAATLAHGCGNTAGKAVSMQFRLDSSVLACAGGARLGQLGFYVSGLRLVDARGAAVPVELQAGPTQSQADGIALVTWTDDCPQAPDADAEAGETANAVVTGRVASASYQAVEFELGVPFELNHANPLTAPPPLNTASMFWAWQTGYKFLRLDIGTDWSFHLGSTGCVSESAVRPPESCRQPNRATIRLPAAAAFDGVVAIDLDGLLAGLDIAVADNCVEAYAERQACRRLLTNLGIDADTGLCTDHCRHQTFFRYEPGTRRAATLTSRAQHRVHR